MKNTPRVTLEQWKTLQTVIDAGGFAQAAERLHRSQSSVSYALHKLQEQLGIALLRTEGRRARLTDTGEALLGRSRRLLQEAAHLEALAASLEQGWEPQIRLVVDAAFPPQLLMRALKHFAPQSQGTRVVLQEVILSEPADVLEAPELCISTQVPPDRLGDALLTVEFVAVAHPEHALFQLKRPLSTQDLEQAIQIVVRGAGAECGSNTGGLGSGARWFVTSIDTALAALREGLGFAWLPRHMLNGPGAAQTLRALPLHEGQVYSVNLFLMFAHVELAGPATRLLADILRHYTAAHADHLSAVPPRT